MLDLDPVKLLILFIVAMILLGPDKLPQVARQLGAGWRKIREYHDQIDRELRANVPDLPSTQDLARLARSPMALLNQLAEMPATLDEPLVEDAAASSPSTSAEESSDAPWPADPAAAPPADPALGIGKEARVQALLDRWARAERTPIAAEPADSRSPTAPGPAPADPVDLPGRVYPSFDDPSLN